MQIHFRDDSRKMLAQYGHLPRYRAHVLTSNMEQIEQNLTEDGAKCAHWYAGLLVYEKKFQKQSHRLI